MDQLTFQALQKWPQVPNCYGWLNFDRRGEWRILNEYAQQHQLSGEKITHSGFKNYIESHLANDHHGNHFFQNGPQRVFISFAYCPWVVRFYPISGGHWELKTTFGQAIYPTGCFLDEQDQISFEAVFEVMQQDENGQYVPQQIKSIALLHDHDLDIFSAFATIFQNGCSNLGEFLWHQKIPIEPINSKDLPRIFQFIKNPKP